MDMRRFEITYADGKIEAVTSVMDALKKGIVYISSLPAEKDEIIKWILEFIDSFTDSAHAVVAFDGPLPCFSCEPYVMVDELR